MAGERTYPCLPCRDLDESIAFYESIGFRRTYRQVRPNPYAVVRLEDLQVHLFGIHGFNPAKSYGTAIVAVPDPDTLYQTFAAGLRSTLGKLPVTGFPRMTRPRKRYGTVRGFSVVDPGGNWLRIYKLGDSEQKASTEKAKGLTHVVEVAARLADAHGDETLALKTLESGLARHRGATAFELAKAYLFRAELAVRTNNPDLARSSLANAHALELPDDERSVLQDEFTHVTELVHQTTNLSEPRL
jgi:catechol 2,3-dioxygenase-like lactoylglutathione lyase family enzyme